MIWGGNYAAMTAMDCCGMLHEDTFRISTFGPMYLVQTCAETGAMVFVCGGCCVARWMDVFHERIA